MKSEFGPILYTDDPKASPYDTDAAAVILDHEHIENSPLVLMPRAFVGSAQKGDRHAIKRVAGDFAEWLCFYTSEQSENADIPAQHKYLLDFMLEALWKINRGEEPNRAFNWTGESKGRPGPTLVESIRRQMIASAVMTIRDEQDVSVNHAVAIVSDENEIPEDKVWSYYKQFKDVLESPAE